MPETTVQFIKKLDLVNYKGFSRFTINFAGSAFLVGPNNAGKSTIIQAIRGCAHMVDHAYAKSPTTRRRDGGNWVHAYPFTRDDFSLVTENVRHEFMGKEARIELTFAGGNKLRVVWPASTDGEEESSFFWLEDATGRQPTRPKEVAAWFPRIGIIPTLMPIEVTEEILNPEYIRRHEDSRLASRHFRNQVYLLSPRGGGDEGELTSYLDFVMQWTPEIVLKDVVPRIGVSVQELDLFYRENMSRTDKEICWAGDGLQIWLQFLLHVYRLRRHPIIVLDEPDVYLHADLQRRLVRVLESRDIQTITATHSAEVLGEASAKSIIWVDRTRQRAVRAPDDERLSQLSDAIGSQFNLRLAKALRSKAVVFIEGKDMKLIRHLAATVGAKDLAAETNVAAIPLNGFSNWENVIPFQWLVENLLEKSIPVFVVLDRDYRSDEEARVVTERLKKLSIDAVVWRRKELESYLLDLTAIQRLTKAPADWLRSEISAIVDGMRDQVFARIHERRARTDVSAKRHLVTVTEQVSAEFSTMWANEDERLYICPPKDVLAALNARLAVNKYKSVSFQGLAKAMLATEVPSEFSTVLLRIEGALKKS